MTLEQKEAVLARSPTNGGKNYPYCEAVLLSCKLEGISPAGWGTIGGDTSNVHYWEYNSTNISNGKPVDISKRHPASKQLTMEKDSVTISNYMNPAFVLDGWTPAMAPIILSQPMSLKVKKDQQASFKVKVAAIPEAAYQWFKNGHAIDGATNAVLNIQPVDISDEGNYSVLVKNSTGSVASFEASLTVN
jgi:pectinesterase